MGKRRNCRGGTDFPSHGGCLMHDARRKAQLEKDISALESKKSRMTDMLIDGTISKEVYDEKLNEFISHQKDIGRRMAEFRVTLEQEKILDEFDRVVFESIIDRVTVGGYDEDGTPDPYKLTFVLKGNQQSVIPDAKNHFEESRKKEGKLS